MYALFYKTLHHIVVKFVLQIVVPESHLWPLGKMATVWKWFYQQSVWINPNANQRLGRKLHHEQNGALLKIWTLSTDSWHYGNLFRHMWHRKIWMAVWKYLHGCVSVETACVASYKCWIWKSDLFGELYVWKQNDWWFIVEWNVKTNLNESLI